MKSFIIKLSMISVLMAPAVAWSQQAQDLNVTPSPGFQQAVQNALHPICGNGNLEEGEDCDLGSKNGDRCASCTSDCHLQWMPADCSTTPDAPLLTVAPAPAGHVIGEKILPPQVFKVETPANAGVETATDTGNDSPAVEVTTDNLTGGGCSFTAGAASIPSLGHALIYSLGLLPLVARRKHS